MIKESQQVKLIHVKYSMMYPEMLFHAFDWKSCVLEKHETKCLLHNSFFPLLHLYPQQNLRCIQILNNQVGITILLQNFWKNTQQVSEIVLWESK